MFKDRLQSLFKLCKEKEMDYLLVKGETDLFYYLGEHLSEGILLTSETESFLYVDGRYYTRCKEKLSHIDHVRLWKRDDEDFDSFIKGKKVALDPYTIKANEWLGFQKVCGSNLIPLDAGSMDQLRLQKDDRELGLIKAASLVTTKGLEYVLSKLQTGIQEKELSDALQIFWLKEFGATFAFDAIVAFGKNTANPHYTPGAATLQEGDFVLIDLGAKLNDYCSDMTRTFYWKEASSEMKSAYSSVLTAFEEAFNGFYEGMTGSEMDGLARLSLEKQGYGDAFCHSLGHGVGIKVHERPNLNTKSEDQLVNGSVFTIEPGVYIPGLGGVRIEDTVYVKDGHLETLTPFSKDPIL